MAQVRELLARNWMGGSWVTSCEFDLVDQRGAVKRVVCPFAGVTVEWVGAPYHSSSAMDGHKRTS